MIGSQTNSAIRCKFESIHLISSGPSVHVKGRSLTAEIARSQINPWESGTETILTLPQSGILDNAIIFKLQKLLPKNQTIKIETITPSNVYVCQLENKECWSEETLISDPHNLEKNKNENVVTSAGVLSIYQKKTMNDALSIKLPKTEKMSSVVIFIKEDNPENDNAKRKMVEQTISMVDGSEDVDMNEV